MSLARYEPVEFSSPGVPAHRGDGRGKVSLLRGRIYPGTNGAWAVLNHRPRQNDADPIIIWQVSDGKEGHLGQSTGLVNALLRRKPAQVYKIITPSFISSLYSCLSRRTGWAHHLPAPRVVIGAGRATHLPLLAAGRAYKAKTVVLMRPSLPPSWFDFCLIPEHDNPTPRDNVIVTQGAVNLMRPGKAHDRRRGLILVGGPSRHYGFDADALISAIKQVLARAPQQHWTLSNSPRTPASLVDAVNELKAPNVETACWDHCGMGWLADQLQRARDVWVTEDSISMIYEALTAGCRVGLLPLPRKAPSRLHKAIDTLLREQSASSLSSWLEGGNLPASSTSLDEADRCAQILVDKGLLA